MNTFTGIGSYKGDVFTDSGLHFIQIDLPRVGNKGNDVPIFVVPNKVIGDTFDAFSPGARLLLNGRLYPSRQDYKMYFVPNAPLQVVTTNVTLNKVNIGGSFCYPEFNDKIGLLKYTIKCSAPSVQRLNHTWNDSLSFRMESWGDDAKRIEMLGHIGRQMIIEGILRYSTWQTADGQQRGGYSVRTRAGLYQFFGKKKTEGDVKVTPTGKKFEAAAPVIAEPYQAPKKESTVVNTSGEDALPF